MFATAAAVAGAPPPPAAAAPPFALHGAGCGGGTTPPPPRTSNSTCPAAAAARAHERKSSWRNAAEGLGTAASRGAGEGRFLIETRTLSPSSPPFAMPLPLLSKDTETAPPSLSSLLPLFNLLTFETTESNHDTIAAPASPIAASRPMSPPPHSQSPSLFPSLPASLNVA